MEEGFEKKDFFTKNRVWISAVVFISVVIGGYLFVFREKEQNFDFIQVEKQSVIATVNVTGRVKPADSVDLAFEPSGIVQEVYVSVGDRVLAGRILAVLNNADLVAELDEASAKVTVEEATRDEFKRGTRPEEIYVQETEVAARETAIYDARKDLIDTLREAYTVSDNAIRNNIDQFITNPRSSEPQLNFSVDSSLESQLEWQRLLAEGCLFLGSILCVTLQQQPVWYLT